MTKAIGRPRNPELATAILDAARALIGEHGIDSISIDAVAAKAGTTRPAFYRRYAGLPEMLLALVVEDFGADIDVDFGDVRSDLLALQREQVSMYVSPLVRKSLAVFLGALQSSAGLNAEFQRVFLRPRRDVTARILAHAAERGEIRSDYDPEAACDLLTGPLLMRVLLPDVGVLDQSIIDDTIDSCLALLQHRPTLDRIERGREGGSVTELPVRVIPDLDALGQAEHPITEPIEITHLVSTTNSSERLTSAI